MAGFQGRCTVSFRARSDGTELVLGHGSDKGFQGPRRAAGIGVDHDHNGLRRLLTNMVNRTLNGGRFPLALLHAQDCMTCKSLAAIDHPRLRQLCGAVLGGGIDQHYPDTRVCKRFPLHPLFGEISKPSLNDP